MPPKKKPLQENDNYEKESPLKQYLGPSSSKAQNSQIPWLGAH